MVYSSNWCSVFDDTLSGNSYLHKLEHSILPLTLNEDGDFAKPLPQDGAPRHFALPVCAYLPSSIC